MTERKKVVPTGGRATAELRHPLETALDFPAPW
jgi:hypothetical protein